VTTDGEGRFFASNLPTGSYRLKASMRGFKNTEVQEVNISGGKRTQLGINLEVGTVSESVSISGQVVTTQSVNDLPISGRNASNLFALTPGVTGRPRLSNMVSSEDSGVTAEASGNDVGDLFEYRIDQPITVQRDRSALIPILQARMEGQRV